MGTLSIKYSKYDLDFFWTLGKDEKLAIKNDRYGQYSLLL